MGGMVIARPLQDDDEQPKLSPLAMLLSGYNRAKAEDMAGGGGGTPSGPTAAAGGPAAAPSPSPAPVQANPQTPTLPQAPKYVPPDMQRRMQLEQAATAPAPNRADYKPSIWDRVFGGMATFGAGLQHNPNAMQLGSEIVGKKFNNAMSDWETKHGIAQEGLTQFDRDADLNQRGFSNENEVFHNEMSRVREGREQTTADALAAQRKATANFKDYKAMGPTDRAAEIPEIEKALGHPLDKDQKDHFVLHGEVPEKAPAKEDLDPEHVILGSIPNGPQRVAKAQEIENLKHREPKDPNAEKPMSQSTIRAINDKKSKGLSETEDWYQKEYANRVKPLYDAVALNKPLPGMDVNASRAARQKAAKDADAQLQEELTKKKQSVQDSYENDISAQGKGAQHVDYKGQGGQKPTTGKKASVDDIQAYAKQKNMPYDKARAAFESSGYQIQ